MIDVALLRQNPAAFQKACNDKNINITVKDVLKVDEKRRSLLATVQKMQAERNSVSKNVPMMKGDEKQKAVEQMKGLGKTLAEQKQRLKIAQEKWHAFTLRLPSIPVPTVPVGKDEKGNVEVKKVGKLPTFSFTPNDHVTLGEALDIIDIPRGVKIAGARSYFLKGDGARLELAVLHCTLDHLIKKGWTLFHPPLMADWDAMMGTGFFPGNEENTYAVGVEKVRGGPVVSDKLYVIGTSEVSVASYHKDEVLDLKGLPKRYCGFSHCFRREAGAYGKDMKGLYRMHQFQKVEQVVLCEANQEHALEMFEEIRNNAEEVLHALELPYRVLTICTGDMGQGKVFMQDIETWMPSRNAYGETHSCSYLGDFQARRLNIKYEDADGTKKFVHTLNNTCIATPRILIPVLEIYQNKDGSVTIPEVLRPYMGGQDKIVKK